MGFKKYFINEEETDSIKQTTPTSQPVQFPKVEPVVAQPSSNLFSFGFGKVPVDNTPKIPNSGFSQEHLQKALEIYQNGFDSLNQPGYDFYEYYQAVSQAGIDNPQVYSMAFIMAVSMEKTITKDKLIQQSEFYINEITKVFNDYVNKGNDKKTQLLSQKTSESQSLSGELSMMEQQLEALKVQIKDRENKLNAIDGKYSPMISEIDSKLSANDSAKNQVVGLIQQVRNGIINNLK
jgi:hypothetical protein